MSIVAAASVKIIATLGVAIVLGLLLCFAGLRYFRVALAALGAVVGALVGTKVGMDLGEGSRTGWIVGMLSGAVLGGLLFVLLWRVGVFALGAGFGAALLTGIFKAVSWGKPEPVLLVAAGTLLGTIAILAKKPLIVLGTAFGGAFAAAVGVAGIIGHYDAGPLWEAVQSGFRGIYEHDALPDLFATRPAYLWAALGAAVAGAVFQWLTAPPPPDKADETSG